MLRRPAGMTQYQITHKTAYFFKDAVPYLELECCLEPRSDDIQSLTYHKLISMPLPNRSVTSSDKFGNTKHCLIFDKMLEKVEVSSISNVEVSGGNRCVDHAGLEQALDWSSLFREEELSELNRFGKQFWNCFYPEEDETKQIAENLSAYIFDNFEYNQLATDINTPLIEVLETKKGVCQDFARSMVALLNMNNVLACYVSGYVFTEKYKHKVEYQGASHAWVSVYFPGLGWRDIDPTNNCWTDERYIKMAIGRDYVDVVPLSGALATTPQQKLKVSVAIEKLSV